MAVLYMAALCGGFEAQDRPECRGPGKPGRVRSRRVVAAGGGRDEHRVRSRPWWHLLMEPLRLDVRRFITVLLSIKRPAAPSLLLHPQPPGTVSMIVPLSDCFQRRGVVIFLSSVRPKAST